MFLLTEYFYETYPSKRYLLSGSLSGFGHFKGNKSTDKIEV